MSKQLTITLDEEMYEGLIGKLAGEQEINDFIVSLLRPHLFKKYTEEELDEAYRQMAEHEEHEAEALEWAELDIALDIEDEYSEAR